MVVCLMSIPGIAELRSDRITDLAGMNFEYWHSPASLDQFNDSVYFPKYGINFSVERIELDLYDKVPVYSVLWISESDRRVTVDVVEELYNRINTSGGDTQKATFGTVQIGDITWHTAAAPRKDGRGFNHVAVIAYTNGKRTATVIMDEIRPVQDLDGFNQTLQFIRFEKPSSNLGYSLEYYS